MTEDGKGHVPVPGVVFSDLVFIEPDLVLAGSEAFLDGPARTSDIHEFTESGAVRIMAVIVGEFTVVD